MPGEQYLILQMHELLSYLNQKGITTMLILGQHGLLGRQEQRLGHFAGGLLCGGIESTDRFDRIAEQFDAERFVVCRRIDIEYAASHAELSGIFDDRSAAIAQAQETRDKRLAARLDSPGTQFRAGIDEDGGRHEPLKQRRNGRDQDRASTFRQAI